MTGSDVVLHLHQGLPGLVLTSLLTGMSRLFRRHSPLLTDACYSIKAQVSLGGLCTSPSVFNLLFFQRWLCFGMVMCFCGTRSQNNSGWPFTPCVIKDDKIQVFLASTSRGLGFKSAPPLRGRGRLERLLSS